MFITLSFQPLFSQNEEIKKLSKEELFFKVFKKKMPEIPKEVKVSIYIKNDPVGEDKVIFDDKRENFNIYSQDLLTKLQNVLKEDVYKDLLQGIVANRGDLSNVLLNKHGIKTELNRQRFLLQIIIPSRLKAAEIHDLKRPASTSLMNFKRIEPASISSNINYSVQQSLRHTQELNSGYSEDDEIGSFSVFNNQQTRAPFNLSLNGALNVYDYVFESSAFYVEDDEFRRGATTLAFDDVINSIAYRFGDVSYRIRGGQSFIPILGVSIGKDDNINPRTIAQQVGSYQFYLQVPAEIEIRINGNLIKTMVLEEGTHSIRNFPYYDGHNDVEIRIKDFSGRKQTMKFEKVFNKKILKKGEYDFGFHGGISSEKEKSGYSYNQERFILGGFSTFGLNNYVNLTPYFQIDYNLENNKEKNLVIGSNYLYVNNLGQFSGNLLLKHHYVDKNYLGVQSSLGYSPGWRMNLNGNSLGWSNSISYSYGYISSVTNVSNSLSFNTSLSISMPGSFKTGANYSYSISNWQKDSYSIGLSLSKSWRNGLSSSLNFDYSNNSSDIGNLSIKAMLSYTFNAGSSSFTVSERMENNSGDLYNYNNEKQDEWEQFTDVSWNYSGLSYKPENFALNALLSFNKYIDQYSMNSNYYNRYALFTADYSLSRPKYDDRYQYLNHYTSMSMRGALTFADGIFALSKPVSSGFILVKGKKALGKSNIYINPVEIKNKVLGYENLSGSYIPAVVGIGNYSDKILKLKPKDFDIGDLDDDMDFKLKSGYKNGFLIEVGSEEKIIISGRLVYENNRPVSLQMINIIPLDEENLDKISTFTNESGNFVIQIPKVEGYEIKFTKDDKINRANLKLPETEESFLEIGDVVLNTYNEPKGEKTPGFISPSLENEDKRDFVDFVKKDLSHFEGESTSTELKSIDLKLSNQYYRKGVAAYKNNNFESALEMFKKAIEYNPDFAMAYYRLGLTYMRQNKYESAIRNFSKALDLNSELVNAYFNRGSSYYRINYFEEAITDFEAVIENNQADWEAYYNKGLCFYRLSDYKQALRDFQQTKSIKPDFVEAYYNSGIVYFKMNDYHNSLIENNEAIKINPGYSNAYFNRGASYYKLGQFENAINDFSFVLNNNPNDISSYYNRGVSFYKMDNIPMAIKDNSSAISIDPGFAAAYYNRGIYYYKNGEFYKALGDYTKAIDLNDKYKLPSLYNRGIVYKYLKVYDKALEDFSEYLRLSNVRDEDYYKVESWIEQLR